MKILLALNSFKGASYSLHVNNALKKGLQKYFPPEQITVFPLCDGGDGSIEALRHHHQWSTISIATQDALGKPIKAQYLWDKNQATAYIELAKASGLANLQGKRNNIMIANTIGTGVLINNAIQKGAKKIILMVGGSATNDAGIGILHSLGVRFLTNSGKEIPPLPRNIPSIRSIDDRSVQRLRSIEVEIWTDVTNPFTGPKGAVTIYGPQKGASPSQQVVLERAMLHFQKLIFDHYHIRIEKIKGTGAAGGIAAGLYPILGATIHQGTEKIFRLTAFEDQVRTHDLIITGEGRLDAQSSFGKLIDGVLKTANLFQKPVIGVCGSIDLSIPEIKSIGFKSVFSIVPGPLSLKESMDMTLPYLEHLGFRLGGMIKV